MRPWYIFALIVTLLLLAINIIAVPIFKSKTEHHLPVHKTLYLDRNLSAYEFAMIAGAAWEWHLATNNMVTFDIERLPSKHIISHESIIVCLVSSDFPEIIELDVEDPSASHMAYYYKYGTLPYIGIVSERISEKDYRPVILHELGHALGLKHNEGIDGIGTLMYPNIDLGATTITDTDLKNFCKLYDCDASKLHDQ